MALKRAPTLPGYKVTELSGPSHAPHFMIKVSVGDAAGAARGIETRGGAGRRAGAIASMAGMTKCGFMPLIGAPNAGKSTLLNRMTGTKLSIVTPKAQTTRLRVLGILMRGAAPDSAVDTPGIFQPQRRLDRAMVAAAWSGAQDADLALLLVDAKTGATERCAASPSSWRGGPARLARPRTRSTSCRPTGCCR